MPTTHHEIQITMVGDKVIPPKIPELTVGDTVRYNYKGEGSATVIFPQLSPYRTDDKVGTEVDTGTYFAAAQLGRFFRAVVRSSSWTARSAVGIRRTSLPPGMPAASTL